ncbi:MAG TPA: hypothetical protein VFH23_05175 [Jiangellaceae bacterium]|nr:hypothetical protein [Jiangellaceae bacterium]
MATDLERLALRNAPDPPRPSDGDALRLLPLTPASEPAFPLLHPYVEVVYAPIVGPTAVLLARSLGRHLMATPGPATVSPVVLALALGLRATHDHPLGKRAALRHALDRLEHAHLVRWLGDTDLGVHTGAPAVNERTLSKLPPPARAAHQHFIAAFGPTAG